MKKANRSNPIVVAKSSRKATGIQQPNHCGHFKFNLYNSSKQFNLIFNLAHFNSFPSDFNSF